MDVRFTVSFDYAPCPTCPSFMSLHSKHKFKCCIRCGQDTTPCEDFGEAGEKLRCHTGRHSHPADECPVLAQILDLHEAMKDPATVGYKKPRLKGMTLFEVYQERWVHSFYADAPFKTIKEQVLDKYTKLGLERGPGRSIPIFIAELKSATPTEAGKFHADLQLAVKETQRKKSPFIGFNIYQFQVNYDACREQGTEWAWDEDARKRGTTSCSEHHFGLFKLGDLEMGEAAQVPVLRHSDKTRSVPIYCLSPTEHWKLRAISTEFGGSVPDTTICEAGKDKHPALHCVASRSANISVVQRQSLYACERLKGRYDCDEVPPYCKAGYLKGDWVFSVAFAHYHDQHPRFAKSLCHFGGAGLLTPIPSRPDCTADPATVGASLDRAPSPSDQPIQPGIWSLVVLMACCIGLACTAGSCWRYFKRSPLQARWAGTQRLSTGLTGGVDASGPQPISRSGTLELADWHDSLPSGGQDVASW